MWRAFHRGCVSRNLYRSTVRESIESGRWLDVDHLRREFVEVKPRDVPVVVRAAEFAAYSGAAMVIHALIAIPAVIARLITDVTLGQSFFQAVKPRKRTDLY